MASWKEISTVSEDGEMWDRDEVLIGLFVKVEENIGPNKSRMYSVKTKDKVVKFWGSTVLDDKLMGVPVGSQVKVEYEGMKQGKRGEYKSYKVFIDTDMAVSTDSAVAAPPAVDEPIDKEVDEDEQSLIDSIPF